MYLLDLPHGYISRPLLYDIFCGAGGATKGYQMAGFRVIGIDVAPQPRYCGDDFHQMDALTFFTAYARGLFEPATCFHCSPPCQRYANVTRWRGRQGDHPDLLPATLALLETTGVPWVIENVPGAPMRCDVQLCGSQFGLRVQRHRWLMLSRPFFALLPPCEHTNLLPFMHKGERAYADAMGCPWMNNREAREAIPPAYTEFLGCLLLKETP